MKYRPTEEPIRLREYGRGVQQLVNVALKVEDKVHRTRMAHEIVRIMGSLVPNLREQPEYKKVLWDHLFYISDMKLDVDTPYERPTESLLEARPTERLPYHKGTSVFKQYGRNIQLMIEKAIEMEDGEEKTAYINRIASIMKMMLNELKQESVPGEVIARHIREISRGRLNVGGDEITIQKQMLQLRNVPKNDIVPEKKNRKRGQSRILTVQAPQPSAMNAGSGQQQGNGGNRNNKWRKNKKR